VLVLGGQQDEFVGILRGAEDVQHEELVGGGGGGGGGGAGQHDVEVV